MEMEEWNGTQTGFDSDGSAPAPVSLWMFVCAYVLFLSYRTNRVNSSVSYRTTKKRIDTIG
jgi:hypothetical protein